MGFDEDKTSNDLELEQHGVRVLIDDESQRLMQGTVVDYKESLMGGGFQIDNPNASATCGCGSSFRTAVDEGKPDSDC
jgi:iron-sulfur cluster assembly protein